MNRCKVCLHPERAAIDAALVRGVAYRKVAAQVHGVSPAAVERHRRHLPSKLIKAHEAQAASDADRLLAKIERLIDEAEGVADHARKEKNWSVVMSALREVRACAELLAKLRGQLDTSGIKIGLAVAVNASSAQQSLSEGDLDLAIAHYVREATSNFDAREIARLKTLSETITITALPLQTAPDSIRE